MTASGNMANNGVPAPGGTMSGGADQPKHGIAAALIRAGKKAVGNVGGGIGSSNAGVLGPSPSFPGFSQSGS